MPTRLGEVWVERRAHDLRRRRRRRRPAPPRPARSPQRDEHRDARGAAAAPGRGARGTTTSGCWSSRRPTTWGSRRAPTCARSSIADGAVRRMELFARLYDELTGFPKPTVAACHGACVGGGAEVAVACDLRVGGSEPAPALPRRRPGRPGRPGAAGHALRPFGGQVPAADRRRRSAPSRRSAGASSTGSPRRREPRRRRSSSPAPSPRPARGGRPALKRMLHEWDDVEGRSRAEGEGQVEWQRSGPGLPFRE